MIGSDRLVGNDRPNIIVARGPYSRLTGNRGNDTIIGNRAILNGDQ
jgi:hypothetical protein